MAELPLESVDELVSGDDLDVAHECLCIAQSPGPGVGDDRDQHLLAQVVPLLAEIVGAQLCQESRHQAVELEKGDPVSGEEPLEGGVPVHGRPAHRIQD